MEIWQQAILLLSGTVIGWGIFAITYVIIYLIRMHRDG